MKIILNELRIIWALWCIGRAAKAVSDDDPRSEDVQRHLLAAVGVLAQ